jgi:hypothetical protein
VSPWAWVAWALTTTVVLAFALIVVGAVVETARKRLGGPRRVVPVAAPGDVDLHPLTPAHGILAAWLADYRDADVAELVAARDEVRRVMPTLGQQLDRLAEEYRRRAPGRSVHPCLTDGHRWSADGSFGLRVCIVCRRVDEVA